MPGLGVLLSFGKSVLTFGITLPVWIFLAAGLWLHFDHSSDIRKAVDQAVTSLVAGAELKAAKAEIEGLTLINTKLKSQADALALANSRFSDNLRKAQFDLENANDQLNELMARPINPECLVDDFIFDRLHNK